VNYLTKAQARTASSAPDSTAASAAPITSTTVSADPTSTTAAVVDLVRRGLAVFPLPPGGRRPAAGGWHARCLTDPSRVRAVWRAGDNIGACRASCVVGLDLDVDGDVQAVLAGLAARSCHLSSPTRFRADLVVGGTAERLAGVSRTLPTS
jgi:bifunctional DNA primase/polymerase-like protein